MLNILKYSLTMCSMFLILLKNRIKSIFFAFICFVFKFQAHDYSRLPLYRINLF